MSKLQGRLAILLLAGILCVQLVGRDDLLRDVVDWEKIGMTHAAIFVVDLLTFLKWAALIGLGVLFTAGAILSAVIWWNVRQVGRAS